MCSLVVPIALVLATGCASKDEDSELDDAAGEDGDANSGEYDGGDGVSAGQGDGDGDGDGGTGGGWDDDGGDGDAPLPDDPNDPEFQPPVEECNDTQDVTLYLSPDDSNSMSSPVQAREAMLSDFGSLSGIGLRTWEFLNYYTFDYAPPTVAGEVALHADLIQVGDDGQYVLQIGVASEQITNDDRDNIALTLVLDTSGSMQGHAMDMLKETCRAIAASLKEGDQISMVTWTTDNSTVLGGYAVSGANDPMVVDKCDALEAGGGTDLHGGLTSGYALAEDTYTAGIINRIVLVSDGGANAGVTDVDIIAAHAGGNDEDGIYMVAVGVGSANEYNDELMDVVSDAGKGASVFINSTEEAQKIFTDGFVNTMGVAARNVAVRLDMPPGFEVIRFSGEEISEDPAEVEPQHLSPNDAMVFHQHIETCAPDLVTPDTEFTVTATYADAKTFDVREISQTFTFAEMISADHSLLLKGAAVFEYAEALKAAVAGEPEPRALADAALVAGQQANPEDADLAEIQTVLDAL
ncbi:MAG: VWA domain-containing protein [Nannocystaceae bacterium]|nr:VWA domain-containing protein [Nannocystaceae bacterium]